MTIVVETRNLVKEYFQGGRPLIVLKNINIQIEKREFMAIMGPWGAESRRSLTCSVHLIARPPAQYS